MSSNVSTPAGAADTRQYTAPARRLSTETKSSYKTTELIVFALAVAGVLIASAVTDETDYGSQEAWFHVTLLAIGYMISRGLAKAGAREPYDADSA